MKQEETDSRLEILLNKGRKGRDTDGEVTLPERIFAPVKKGELLGNSSVQSGWPQAGGVWPVCRQGYRSAYSAGSLETYLRDVFYFLNFSYNSAALCEVFALQLT